MLISLVTATWNCRDTIEQCLDSVLWQSWRSIEHIVIDGCSSDGTIDVLRSRKSQLTCIVSEPDRGIYDALNKGLTRATGQVVGFLHADDLFADKTVLERVAEAFRDPAVSAVYGDLRYVQKNDATKVVRHWRGGDFSKGKLKWGWMPPHPTLYVRREWYEKTGGFDVGYSIAADYLSILRLFSNPEFKALYLPFVMVTMRLGGASNRSLRNIVRKSMEDYRALRSTQVGGIGALLWKNLSKVSQFG